ncbi:MAG: polysaccharide biosynthesis C-terminal domain-containing protein, partial [Clostridia bacterium]|nr:polysaccharide biosynthesis C-terminal domain-containing protein [Clostridia bacterium]
VPLTAVRIITSISASITALIIPERLVAFGMDIGTATAEYGRVSGMALPLIMAPVSLISSLSVVLIPDIASLYAKRDYKEIKQKLGMVITFSAVIASLFFALYLPLGKELGKLFFGDETAGKFVSYCSALIFPIAFAQATTPMLNSLGMETKTLISYLIGLCFTLPCVFFLPKFIGVYSVAVGSGLGFLATGIFNLVCLSKKLSGIKEINLKKAGITVAFSIPLAVLGVLGFRLLSPYLEWFASFITGFYVVFLFIIFASAFDIVDIQGFLVSLKRTQTLKSRKKHRLNGKIKA